MTEVVQFRWGQSRDCEAIFEVQCSAFHLMTGSSKWNQARQLVESQTESYRVMEVEGDIVGSCHVSRHPLQIGSQVIQLAYLGQISVLPECQRQGYGTQLIWNLIACLDETGYDLARLSGLVRFYRRFGWTPFPRRFVEFPLQDLKVGIGEISISDILQPGSGLLEFVRPFEEEQDRAACDVLQRQFHAGRTGASQAPRGTPWTPFTHDMPEPWQLVFERDGVISGYVSTHVFSDDVSGFEAAVNLREVAFDLEQPEAVIALLRYVLWEAHRRGARRVTARLPWDPRLFSILSEGGLIFERVELLNPVGGNMLRTLNLSRTLQKIEEELTLRWQRSGETVRGWLELEVNQERVCLGISDSVRVVTDPSQAPSVPTWTICLTQTQFLMLLLGLAPVETVLFGERLQHELLWVIGALFPMQTTASSTWG